MSHNLDQLSQRFPQRRAFITGAGSGLGLALARLLVGAQWRIGLFDRDAERLTKVEGELTSGGANVLAYPGDVTQADELTVAVNSFAGTHDGFDIMINNAGVACAGGLLETSLEDWRWIVDINLLGVVHGCRAALPHLQRHQSGLLINIASAAAFGTLPNMSAYNATKAAVLALSETLMGELRESGVQVSVVMPTFFKTSLLDSMRGPDSLRQDAHALMESAPISAQGVAQELLLQAARGRHHIVLPASARWIWRFKRLFPAFYLRRIGALRQHVMTSAYDRLQQEAPKSESGAEDTHGRSIASK